MLCPISGVALRHADGFLLQSLEALATTNVLHLVRVLEVRPQLIHVAVARPEVDEGVVIHGWRRIQAQIDLRPDRPSALDPSAGFEGPQLISLPLLAAHSFQLGSVMAALEGQARGVIVVASEQRELGRPSCFPLTYVRAIVICILRNRGRNAACLF